MSAVPPPPQRSEGLPPVPPLLPSFACLRSSRERERERGAAASVAVTAFGKAELRKVASLPPPRRPLVPRRLGLRGHRCRCRHTHPSPPPPSLSVSSSGRGRLVAWLVEPCQSVCPPRSVRGAFHSLTRRRRTKARPPAEARTRRGGQY